jgi:hypothetical protein
MSRDRLRGEDHPPDLEGLPPPRTTAVPCEDREDLCEELHNFRMYLEILREWDAREKHRGQSDIIEQIHGS